MAEVARVDLQEFAKLSPENRRKAVMDRTVIPPKRGTPEREQFDSLLMGNPPAPKDPPKDPPKPGEGDAAAAGAKTDGTAAGGGDGAPQYGGFASIDELIADHKSTKTLLAERDEKLKAQADIIRKINNTASSQGRTLERLEAELAKVNAELEESRKRIAESTPAAEIKDAELGDPPDPDNFEEGLLDQGYHKAMADYNRKLGGAYAALSKANSALRSELSSTKATLEKVEKGYTTIEQTSAQKQAREQMESFFGEVQKLQESYGLKMPVSFEEINGQVLILQDQKASVDAKAAAKAFIDAQKPETLQTFDKILKAVHARYRFDKGRPQAAYMSWDGAIIDQGLEGDFPKVSAPKPADAAAEEEARLKKLQQMKASGDVDPLPAGAGGDKGDKPLSQQSGDAGSKMRRIRELETLRGRDPAAFRANTKVWEEYKTLRREIGYPVRG